MSKFKPGEKVVVARSWKSEADPMVELKYASEHEVSNTMGTTLTLVGFPGNFWFNEERFLFPAPELGEVTVDRVDAMITERGKDWGEPINTWTRVAQVWSGILGHEVTARQAVLMMAGFKTVRAEISPTNQDSYVDGHAYLRFAEDFAE